MSARRGGDVVGRERLVYISLGSNIAPERHLPLAVARLGERLALRGVSGVWRSRPVGGRGGDFLNAAVVAATDLAAVALKFEVLRAIEAALGRVRGPDRNAPRPIDLDVVLDAAGPLDVPDGRGGRLRLPDPDIARAAHVALPLAELAPALQPFGDGRTLAELAAAAQAAAGADAPVRAAAPDLAAALARARRGRVVAAAVTAGGGS